MHKRITALLAVPALLTFGLAAATSAPSASASTLPPSVNAAPHTVRSAAANTLGSPAGEQHAGDDLTLESSDLTLAYVGPLCLKSTEWCIIYTAEDTQATIADGVGVTFDFYDIRQVSGTNTFTDGSGYNALYAGDVVYCLEDSNDDFLHAGQEADGDVMVEGWTAGVCTGVWDEWVKDGDWWINVGETDWYYSQGETQYPYSSVITSGCDNDTTCRVWVEESTPSGNDDNLWYIP